MKKTLAVVLCAVLVMMTLTGCGKKYAFEAGTFSVGRIFNEFAPDPPIVGVRAETDTFDRDDVSVTLYYGLYDIDYKDTYSYKMGEDDDVVYAVYVAPAYSYMDSTVTDYKNVADHYFVRALGDAEVDDDCAFVWGATGKIKYMHSETLTIPAELFDAEIGRLEIKIVSFSFTEGTAEYHVAASGLCRIEYKCETRGDGTTAVTLSRDY